MSTSLPLTLVGASGLLAGEALRLIEQHPRLHLCAAVSRRSARPLVDLHPQLAGSASAAVVTSESTSLGADLGAQLDRCEGRVVLLMALPHAQAAHTWREVRAELGPSAERVLVVDLSADYRLKNASAYARWYAEHPDPQELPRFRYGLPELVTQPLLDAQRIAAPGCFATALQLACLPASEAGLLDEESTWSLTAITGSSGAGMSPSPTTHHPLRAGNLWAYGIGGHRHTEELVQALGARPALVFLPHSGPFVRGIHLTAILPLRDRLDLDGVRGLYRERFHAQPFVEVLEGDAVPDLRRVVGSNRVSLALHGGDGCLVVLLTLDNLIKGGAGQALQALNLALGWPQELGLPSVAFGL